MRLIDHVKALYKKTHPTLTGCTVVRHLVRVLWSRGLR